MNIYWICDKILILSHTFKKKNFADVVKFLDLLARYLTATPRNLTISAKSTVASQLDIYQIKDSRIFCECI